MTTRRSRPTCLLLALAACCTAASAASAATMVCTPGPAAGNAPFNAVRRISIDEFSRTVNLDVVRSKTRETETLGKMRADLVGLDESSGEPVYVFNSIPTSEVETTTLFKLSKAGEWRLTSATLSIVGKVPMLRSVDGGTVFNCKRSSLG